ncbi:MAG: NUDIX domain-containing protein [Phycisphaerales bacterium]|nr:MAG: NUDIX domain-containing protein [Phycisphaerales bacterium]
MGTGRTDRAGRSPPTYAVGFIQRSDRRYLIFRQASGGAAAHWQFPRGLVRQDESPEAAMRRVAQEQVGIEVQLDVGQPPLLVELEGREVCFRCFLAGVIREASHRPCGIELQWVQAVQLLEFDFGPEYRQIVPWLADL